MTSLIRVPFADSGDKTVVPETDSGGGVNMTQGYGQAYSLDPATDPSAKRIERDKMNGLFHLITSAIGEIQASGCVPFITSDDNGGTPYSYGKGALTILNGVIYQSLEDANTTTPPGAKWSVSANLDNSVGRLLAVKKLTSSGTYTPTEGTKFCIAELQAGGGGGGSTATCANGQSAGGSGGSAGGYALIKFTAANSAVVIGGGGSGGVASPSGTNGSNGGDTSIAGVTVFGGGGGWSGPARSTFPQGNNSAGRTGSCSNTGSATIVKDVPGQSGQGGIAYGPYNVYGGGGGSSPLGTGAGGGISTSSSGAGVGASNYGSGGSGSASVSGTSSAAGGGGSAGVIIIWEYS